MATRYGTEGAIKLLVNINYYITNKNNLFIGGGFGLVFKPDYDESYMINDGKDIFILRNITDKEFFINYKLKAGYTFDIRKSKLMMEAVMNFMPNSMDQNILEYRGELFKYDISRVSYSLGLRYYFL